MARIAIVIAIVDDEQMLLDSLRRAFEAAGHDVETYADATIALPHLICEPPSVLILGGNNPGLHGIDFFAKYRTFTRSPVVVLSASASEIGEKLHEIGTPAFAYIDKPFSLRELIAVVERAASQHAASA
jgi:DNA-binding response OmpR family regulator